VTPLPDLEQQTIVDGKLFVPDADFGQNPYVHPVPPTEHTGTVMVFTQILNEALTGVSTSHLLHGEGVK
jgi:hypothetical protein